MPVTRYPLPVARCYGPLVSIVLTVACGAGEPLSDLSVETKTQELKGFDELEESGPSCVIEPEDDPVKIIFRQIQSSGHVELSAGLPLKLELELHPSRDIASLELLVEAETEFEEKAVRFPAISTGPGRTESIDVDWDMLGLSRAALNISGNIEVSATALRSDGEVETTVTAGASFHPASNGWLVYDEAVKRESFDGGRLSERVREMTSAPLTRTPSIEELGRKTPVGELADPYYAFARVTKRSDRTDVPQGDEDD